MIAFGEAQTLYRSKADINDDSTRRTAQARAHYNGTLYTVIISPEGLKLAQKGRRKGYELDWNAFVSGDAALATALNASNAAAPDAKPAPAKKPK